MSIQVLVTGSRGYRNRAAVARALAYVQGLFPGTAPEDFTLIHGDCKYYRKDGTIDWDRSADQLADQEAKRLGWQREPDPVTEEEQQRYGNYAFLRRNLRMVARQPDVCIAFPGGRGTNHCREAAAAAGIRVIKLAEVPA